MNYIKNKIENQDNLKKCLIIPTTLENFVNTETEIKNGEIIFRGYIPLDNKDCLCPKCNHLVATNQYHEIVLKHIPIGGTPSKIIIKKNQSACRRCGITFYQHIPFQADNHFITKELKTYIIDLLELNHYTNKEISELTNVNRNIIKEIDLKRLKQLYTIDGNGKKLIRPKDYSNYLSIDEFKLHNGYKYATHIIDYKTGHILWIAEGKKKQVVYDFIKHVGFEWMQHVKAVSCDMNSDFEEAFKEMCPHIEIVYDHFHIVKYLNEKVIAPIRIEEQNKLLENGDKEAANRLKRTKMILCSSEETLKKKDKEVQEEKEIQKGSKLFNTNKLVRSGSFYDRYLKLINDNEIFLTIELIKQCINEAFITDSKEVMCQLLFDVMELCEASGNKYLKKFENLIYNHFEGIITHSKYKISTGKIEGINNKIKTIRRQAYGYPDDEYFFLKLLDMSRH